MNIFKRVLIATLSTASLLATSCTSDDDSQENESSTYTQSGYMNANIGDYWTYTTTSTGENNTTETVLDSLYFAGNESLNNKEYINLDKTSGSGHMMSTLITESLLREENGSLFINGTINMDGLDEFTGADNQSFGFELNDEVIANKNVSQGTVLFSKEDSFSSPVNVEGVDDLEISINFTLKAIQQETIPSLIIEGVTYNNIIKSDIIIEATIDGIIGGFIPINIAPQQDIIKIENYFADGIGLVKSDSNFSLNFNPAVAGQIGSEDMSDESSMNIVSYNVSP